MILAYLSRIHTQDLCKIFGGETLLTLSQHAIELP